MRLLLETSLKGEREREREELKEREIKYMVFPFSSPPTPH
jgi:hypothetical protein